MALSHVSLAGQAVDGSAARSDLVLLSVLAPLMVSNLSAKISPTLGASDASLGRGAVCATFVNQDIAELKGLVHETGRSESLLAAMGEELAGL